MFKYLVTMFIALFTIQSHAGNFATELCALEYSKDYDATFTEISVTEIFEYTAVSEQLLEALNFHLQQLEYTTENLSLEEIIFLFSQEGEYYYDNFTVTIFETKKTGAQYLQTMSWPGDNPYSFNYDAQTFELKAIGRDGTVTLIDGSESQNCN